MVNDPRGLWWCWWWCMGNEPFWRLGGVEYWEDGELGDGFKFLLCSPRKLGKWSNLTNSFQLGLVFPRNLTARPEKWWLEDDPFLLGPGQFSGGYVKFPGNTERMVTLAVFLLEESLRESLLIIYDARSLHEWMSLVPSFRHFWCMDLWWAMFRRWMVYHTVCMCSRFSHHQRKSWASSGTWHVVGIASCLLLKSWLVNQPHADVPLPEMGPY